MLASSHEKEEDVVLDTTLRPQAFGEYIGQRKIKDNLETGEVDFECRLDGNDSNKLPTGAGIIHAYLAAHIGEITQGAQDWFRAKLVEAAAKSTPEIVQ